jgi:hypothetical protein
LLAPRSSDDASIWDDVFVINSCVGLWLGVVDGLPAIDGRKGAMRDVWAASVLRKAAQVVQDGTELTSQACWRWHRVGAREGHMLEMGRFG